MTMVSFSVDDNEAAAARRWADHLGIDESELLRIALHQYLVRQTSDNDAVVWTQGSLSEPEAAIRALTDWGWAEDWSDWADAAR
jgi:hypothetical protein